MTASLRVQLLHTCANKNYNSTSMKFCLLPWNCFFLLQASSTACKVCSAVARRAGRLRSSSKRDWGRMMRTSFLCIIFFEEKNSLTWVHIRVLIKGNLIRCINFDFYFNTLHMPYSCYCHIQNFYTDQSFKQYPSVPPIKSECCSARSYRVPGKSNSEHKLTNASEYSSKVAFPCYAK